jgi:hypothetical protein
MGEKTMNALELSGRTSRWANGLANSRNRAIGRRLFGKALLGLFSSIICLPKLSGRAAAFEGNPTLVAGFQVGQRMQGILDGIAVALNGVKDVETAKQAVKTFSDAEFKIVEIEPFLLLLPHEGKTAIAAQVIGAIIVMKPTAEKLMADSTIGPILKPGFDKLVDKFKSLGG